MEMENNTFKCEVCKGTFIKDWSDEEAIAEKESMFGKIPLDQCGTVCEVCHDKLMKRFKTMKVAGHA